MKKFHSLTNEQQWTAIHKVGTEERYDIRQLFDYRYKMENDGLKIIDKNKE